MTLTPAEKRKLRSAGQTLADDVRVGKAGLSDGFLRNLGDLLRRRELVKLRFTDIEGDERHEFAKQVAAAAEAHLVAVTGRTALLYRRNDDLPDAKRVVRL